MSAKETNRDNLVFFGKSLLRISSYLGLWFAGFYLGSWGTKLSPPWCDIVAIASAAVLSATTVCLCLLGIVVWYGVRVFIDGLNAVEQKGNEDEH